MTSNDFTYQRVSARWMTCPMIRNALREGFIQVPLPAKNAKMVREGNNRAQQEAADETDDKTSDCGSPDLDLSYCGSPTLEASSYCNSPKLEASSCCGSPTVDDSPADIQFFPSTPLPCPASLPSVGPPPRFPTAYGLLTPPPKLQITIPQRQPSNIQSAAGSSNTKPSAPSTFPRRLKIVLPPPPANHQSHARPSGTRKSAQKSARRPRRLKIKLPPPPASGKKSSAESSESPSTARKRKTETKDRFRVQNPEKNPAINVRYKEKNGLYTYHRLGWVIEGISATVGSRPWEMDNASFLGWLNYSGHETAMCLRGQNVGRHGWMFCFGIAILAYFSLLLRAITLGTMVGEQGDGIGLWMA